MKRDPRRQRQEINAAFDAWGAAFGKPEAAARLKQTIKPPRQIANRSPGHMLERAVCDEIEPMLRAHPMVFMVQRFNSGGAEFEKFNDGSYRVKFWSWVRRPPREAFPNSLSRKLAQPDYMGTLVGGRQFVIEAKARNWRLKASDERAQAQQNYINAVIANGGLGGFARSAEEALAILEATHCI